MLPENDDGLTLFTTRHGAVAQHVAGSDVIELGGMTEGETIELLERSLIRRDNTHGNKDMMDLLTELEYLPLAVKQAAAYVNTNKSSVSEYIILLKNTTEDAFAIMSTDFGDKTRCSNLTNAIAKTWTITFDKILHLDPIAADLLKFMSCIEWRAIPYSILPAACSKARLAKAIGLLCAFSLIERIDHGTKFNMHRLVHLATRIWVRRKCEEEETIKAAFKQLSEVFPCDYYTDHETWQEYMPHVDCMERYNQQYDSSERAELCMRVGKFILGDERVEEAIVWLQKSCEWRDKNLPPHNTQRLTSQRYLAMAYRQNGQLKESIDVLDCVISIPLGVLAEADPDRLSSQYQLAISYQASGQTEKSIKLLEDIVGIQAILVPPNDGERLASQYMLAMAYQANGRIHESIELLEHIIGTQGESLAEDDPKRLASQHRLAMAYSDSGQAGEAIKLLKQVCAIKAKSFAEDHPDRLVSEYALAMACKDNSPTEELIKLPTHTSKIEAYFLLLWVPAEKENFQQIKGTDLAETEGRRNQN